MSAPRRLLMTTDAVGGIWTYALDLARGLAGEGVSTTLAVLGPPPCDSQKRAAEAIPQARLVPLDAPLDWTAANPDEVRAAGRAVAELALWSGADLVHLNHPPLAAEAPFVVPVVAVAHSCVATWWAAMREGGLPPDLAWRAALTARGYRRSDAILAPSAAFAEATRAVYGTDLSVAVVPNGRAAPARGVKPAGPTEPFLLTAGRLWDEGKGCDLLDEIAARTCLSIIAAGPTEGPNGAAIQFRKVTPTGVLSSRRLAPLMRGCMAYLSPSRYEPFGLVVLEAAQHGRPLILADIPTYRELWADAALFAPAADAAAFAAQAERIAADAALAAALGRAARAKARRYSVEAMTRGTMLAYATAMGASAAGAAA